MTESSSKHIRVLLIEDNPLDVRLVRADFDLQNSADYHLSIADNLEAAIDTLEARRIDVVLLGLETLARIRAVAPDVAVVVLTDLNDETQAILALKQGAQDYLIKGSVIGPALFRAIRYSVERKQHERDHDKLERRQLQDQNFAAISTLAGGVAHNFNNSLMVILGHSNLMLEGTSSEDGRKRLESIIRAAAHASNLTRQLLTFSRRHPVEPVATSLNSILCRMQGLMESVLDGRVALELTLSPNAEIVIVDPNQIQEMIMNLVLNARSAIGSDGRIAITTSRNSDFPGEVLLSIADTGCGMSEETRARIFEPFFTTKGLTQAPGLGLSTVHGIVKQHDAALDVSSELGHGTTITIRFPLCRIAVKASEVLCAGISQ